MVNHAVVNGIRSVVHSKSAPCITSQGCVVPGKGIFSATSVSGMSCALEECEEGLIVDHAVWF